jgi:hypothetical protein
MPSLAEFLLANSVPHSLVLRKREMDLLLGAGHLARRADSWKQTEAQPSRHRGKIGLA